MLGGRGNKAGGSGRCTNAYCISVGVVPLCDRLELLILMLLLNKRFDESIFERRKLPTLLLVRASHVLGGIDRARCWPGHYHCFPAVPKSPVNQILRIGDQTQIDISTRTAVE